MNLYLTILLIIFLLSVYSLILSLGMRNKGFGLMLSILTIGIILRYISLFIYLVSMSPFFLYNIRNSLLLSVISIPLLSFICINRVNNGKLGKQEIILMPILAIVYIYIIIMSPERIISDEIGYRLILKSKYIYYLSAIQGIFSVYIIYITSKHIFKNTIRQIKVINTMFFMGYILALCEGIALLFNKPLLKSPILSEGFLILAIIIALREIKKE